MMHMQGVVLYTVMMSRGLRTIFDCIQGEDNSLGGKSSESVPTRGECLLNAIAHCQSGDNFQSHCSGY